MKLRSPRFPFNWLWLKRSHFYSWRVHRTFYCSVDLERVRVDCGWLSVVSIRPGDHTWRYLPPAPHRGPGRQWGEGKTVPVNREAGGANFCPSSKDEQEEKVRTQETTWKRQDGDSASDRGEDSIWKNSSPTCNPTPSDHRNCCRNFYISMRPSIKKSIPVQKAHLTVCYSKSTVFFEHLLHGPAKGVICPFKNSWSPGQLEATPVATEEQKERNHIWRVWVKKSLKGNSDLYWNAFWSVH